MLEIYKKEIKDLELFGTWKEELAIWTLDFGHQGFGRSSETLELQEDVTLLLSGPYVSV